MRHIRETQSMAEVRPLFEQQDVGAVEVFDDVGQAIGVLTQTDVDAAVREARLENQVGECLRYRVTGDSPSLDIADVSSHGFDHEPLRSVLNALHDGVYITDARGITVTVNTAYERLTGIRRDDVVGRHMADLVKAGYISKSVSLEVIRERRPITLVQSIRDHDKILVSGMPLLDNEGALRYVITSVRDVTELLRAKHAQEQLAQIRRMREAYDVDVRIDDQPPWLIVSPQSRACYALARRIAPTQVKVLIQGETGTGKTLLARYIHQHSERAEGPFLELNCTAMPEGLLEAELFGYSPGAFTGAAPRGKQGLLDVAHGGTLLLDEIGDLPLALQAKLLKVVEENRFLPVGGTEFRHANIRLICATHRDLQQQVHLGQFREDLYYRLSVVPLTLPPLRERREEIIPLLNHYLEHFNQRHHQDRCWHPESLELLAGHDWPGNIRELINLTERLVVSATEQEITPHGLPHVPASRERPDSPAIGGGSLREQVTELERQLIETALATHGTTRAAAAALGIDQSTLVKKTRRWRCSRSA
ncbi:PAS domain S-box-containing protein [Halomonas caseinilytica]|uniref:HTH-type transcriptional regulatory protein TyrR n=2 Tax=Halomonas caseinilytica TaxID=438744 RepID=A0A1M6ZNE0_9GAMM|nr:PAS domain S-box-containing protein [Halomonas caseinilytica]SHL31976.1 PAS domain S-box-containing protein [Halomonas caseinilytica]